jgi:hypothetical protein
VVRHRTAAIPAALGAVLLAAAALSYALLAAAGGPDGPPAPRATGFYRGMTLGLFSREDPVAIEADLAELRHLGVDAISLVAARVLDDVHAVALRDGRWVTPSEGALRTAIRGAHRRGMRVLLFPTVFVADLGPGEWRGTLDPPDWDAWFRAYRESLLRYARLAAEEGVELFSVGSELCSSERHEARWRETIAAVREVYSGRILYSANWDHYRDIPFLDALDYLGINAYYQLTEVPRPEVEDLRRSWEPIRADLLDWARREGRSLLFTEVGYPSREGAGIDPWDHTAQRPVDLETQRRAYRAFIETWRGTPEIAGVFFYLWWGDGGPDDTDYTPRRKPAQQEIAGWFREPRPSPDSEEAETCSQSQTEAKR